MAEMSAERQRAILARCCRQIDGVLARRGFRARVTGGEVSRELQAVFFRVPLPRHGFRALSRELAAALGVRRCELYLTIVVKDRRAER